uniref:Uncharacterized protein n=1 Tax=Caulobacter phage BL57 TaxID=3348355 RepID=A0AB74UN48_9VIRU
MAFGQYSHTPQVRRSKRDMVASLPADVQAALASAKLAARNTLDYTTSDGTRRVRLHDTDVLTMTPDGRVMINTGGWNTLTTRDRINGFAPPHVQVYSDKGQPNVRAVAAGESLGWDKPAASKAFDKAATVYPDGRIEVDASPDQLAITPALIKRYLAAFKAGFPFNSKGDPWISPGAVVDHATALDWLGAESGKPYLFDSILYHAHIAAGISEVGARMYMGDLMRDPSRLDRFHLDRIRRYFKRALREG